MPKAVPERWEEYCPIGRRIKQTRFIAFKVPLKGALCSNLDFKLRWTLDDLMNHCPEIGMIIDLTLTARYYNFKDVLNKGVDYCKIACPGQVIPPEPLVKRFFSAIDTYLENHQDDDSLIGIHCTHGVNRSGYMVARYLVQRMGFSPDDAVKCVGEARSHPIERPNYVKSLSKFTERVPKVLDSSDILGEQGVRLKPKAHKVRGFNVNRPVGNAMPDKFRGNRRGRGGIRDSGRRGGKIGRDWAPDNTPHWDQEELRYQREFVGREDDDYNAPRNRNYNPEQYQDEHGNYEEHCEDNYGNDDQEHFRRHNFHQGQSYDQFTPNDEGQQREHSRGEDERAQRRRSRPFNRFNDQHEPEEHGNYGRPQQRPPRGGYRGGFNRGNNRFGNNYKAPTFEYGNNQDSKPLHQELGGRQSYNQPHRNSPPNNPIHHPPAHQPQVYGSRDRAFSPPHLPSQDHLGRPEPWAENPLYNDLPPPPKKRAFPQPVGPRNRPFQPPPEPNLQQQQHFNSGPQQRRGRSIEQRRMSPPLERRDVPVWNHPPRRESPPSRRRMETPPRRPLSPPRRQVSPPPRSGSPSRGPMGLSQHHENVGWPSGFPPNHQKPPNRYGSPPRQASRGGPSHSRKSPPTRRISPLYQRGNSPHHHRMSPPPSHRMRVGSNDRMSVPPLKRKGSPLPRSLPHYPRANSPHRREKSPPSHSQYKSPPSRSQYKSPPPTYRRAISPRRSRSPSWRRKLSPGNQKVGLPPFQGMDPSQSRGLFPIREKKERSPSPPLGKSGRALSREHIDGRPLRKDGREHFKPHENSFLPHHGTEDSINIDGIPIGSGFPPPPKFLRGRSPPKPNQLSQLKQRRSNSPGLRPNVFYYAGNELSSSNQPHGYRGNPRDMSPDMPLSKSPARFTSGSSDWRYSGNNAKIQNPMRDRPSNELYSSQPEGRKDIPWREFEKQPYRENRRSRSFSPTDRRQSRFHDHNPFVSESRDILKSDDPLAREDDCRAIILQKRLTTGHEESDSVSMLDLFSSGEARNSRAIRQSPPISKNPRRSPSLRSSPPRLGKDVASRLSKRRSPEDSCMKKPIFDRLDAKKPPIFDRLQAGTSPKKPMMTPARGYPPLRNP